MLLINNHQDSILKEINYRIKDSLLILGSNGAGKSSLAKLICGITPSNSIEFNKINLNSFSHQDRTKVINYIPSKLDIFDEYITLRDYLYLSKIDNSVNVNKVIDTLSLKHLQDRACIKLSSGESQLLLVASAIIHNAQITIFDEPTANLDPTKTSQIYKILSDREVLKTKIVITHDLNLAYKLGFDIIYLKDGKIIFKGTNSEFFNINNIKKTFDNRVKKVKDFWVVDI